MPKNISPILLKNQDSMSEEKNNSKNDDEGRSRLYGRMGK